MQFNDHNKHIYYVKYTVNDPFVRIVLIVHNMSKQYKFSTFTVIYKKRKEKFKTTIMKLTDQNINNKTIIIILTMSKTINQ